MDKIIPDSASGLPAGLSQPALRALNDAGVTTLEEAAQHSDKELLALHGMGPKGIRILKEALAERGLGFAKP